MKNKFEKEEAKDQAEEKRLIQKYKLKITTFVNIYKALVRRNKNVWSK